MSPVEVIGQVSSKSKNLPASTSAKQMVPRGLEALGPSHHPVKQVLYSRMGYFISQSFSFLICEKEIDNKAIFTELLGGSSETKCRKPRYTNVIYLCYFREKQRVMEVLI